MRKHHTIRTSGRVTARPPRRPAAELLAGAVLTGALVSALYAGSTGHHTRSGAAAGLSTSARPGGAGRITLVDSVTSTGRVWVAGADGRVTTPDGAPVYGQLASAPAAPVVAAAATPDGNGYWLAGADGGVFPYGDAGFHGSTGGIHLAAPIVAMAPTPSGQGYWLVASDGGVFPFGDAGFHGSTGGIGLVAPIVAAAPTPSGHGYWLVGSDGGIFSFGDAVFHGSLGSNPPSAPLRSMVSDPAGGYWLIGATGAVYPFGPTGNRPSVAVASTPSPVALAAAQSAVGAGGRALAFAEAQIGKPYVWGGSGPGAYDCSGLTQSSWGSAGIPIPRLAASQYGQGALVPVAAAAPGDLVFWSSNGAPSGIYHVGMALGNGQMIDAAKPGTAVRVEAIWPGALPLATQP